MKLFQVVICLLMIMCCNAQELVPNGSFEIFSQLPNDDCDWFLASGWTNAASTSECNSSNGTPDYYHLYGTGPYSMLPTNFFSELFPDEGSAVMGLLGYSNLLPDAREYVSIQLAQPLEIGMLYNLSFSLTQGVPASDNFSVNGWGAALSVNPILQSAGTNDPIPIADDQFLVPQIVSSSNWEVFSFQFMADSAYNFITLGNFKSDNQLTIQSNGNPGFFAFAYIFLDHVSVLPVNPLPVSLLSFRAESISSAQNLISWSTATEIINDFFIVERSSNGQSWKKVQQVEGAGNSNQELHYSVTDNMPYDNGTYYRLKQVDFDGSVSFSEPTYVKSLQSQISGVRVYPSPANDIICVELNEVASSQIEVFEQSGKMVISNSPWFDFGPNSVHKLDISGLDAGVYFLRAAGQATRFVKR